MLFQYAKELGVKFGGNIGIPTLKDRVENKLQELKQSSEKIVEGAIPRYSIYFLDGKHFENVSEFFQRVFFKEMSRGIWYEEVEDGKTIEEIVREILKKYAETLKDEIEDKGIKEKLKSFLPNLTDISVDPVFEPREINIGVKVQLLESNGREILLEKKGDGTKRRITMALLEYRKFKEEGPVIYVFDEPDTHLHVKAQVELLEIIREFNNAGKQVIITTHSPFIMNAVKPKQIRLLSIVDGETKVKHISSDEEVERILINLGIENVNLFFSKKILIVEGETEEEFLKSIYYKLFDRSLNNDLIKIFGKDGITDVPRLAKVLQMFVKPEDIFILMDNDADEKTEEIINKLSIPPENIFKVGDKEFEDAFDPEVIYEAWKNFVNKQGKEIGEEWTVENIKNLKNKCKEEELKFSEELRELNKGCPIGMSKPRLGRALGEYCGWNELNDELRKLLERISS